MTIAKALGKVGKCMEDVSADAAPQHGGPNGTETFLLLPAHADMITVQVIGNGPFLAWIEFEAHLLFYGGKHLLGGPTMAHEEILEPSARAVLPQFLLLAEDLAHGDDRGERHQPEDCTQSPPARP